jgi:hypothetical protein
VEINILKDLAIEALKAVIYMVVGATPVIVGVAISTWAQVKSLKRSMNAAHAKIRDLEGRLGVSDNCKNQGREL